MSSRRVRFDTLGEHWACQMGVPGRRRQASARCTLILPTGSSSAIRRNGQSIVFSTGVLSTTRGPADRARLATGQLGIVRVGVDRRTAAERNGNPPLWPGIYALCEVESEAFPGTGANDEFWADDEGRSPGWPTVKLRYLRTYMNDPLTIERLRGERPGVSKLLLNGYQAASFPIPADDFHAVMSLLGETLDDLPHPQRDAVPDFAELAALEAKYQHASPEVKQRVSEMIERGPIGALVKQANGYKCQLCEALGRNAIAFLKPDGEPYVEAHHVTPVSHQEVGSLSASNVMTVCANHHRQIHYGGVKVNIGPAAFTFVIDGRVLTIAKAVLPAGPRAARGPETAAPHVTCHFSQPLSR